MKLQKSEFTKLYKSFHPSYQQPANRYVYASKFTQNCLVLELACGPGFGSSYLVEKGANEIIGGDLSKEAIDYANRYYKSDAVNFINLDAENLPFRTCCFDVIVSLETIEHLKKPDRFLSECTRVLRKPGVFVCSTPNKEFSLSKGTKNPFHICEFSLENFCDLLSRHFVEYDICCQLFPITIRQNVKSKLKSKGYLVLSMIPYGERIKELVKKFIFHCREGEKIINHTLDEAYSVLPLKAKMSKTPATFVAVARKVKN